MEATGAMVSAVRSVAVEHREEAAALADRTFRREFDRREASGEFNRVTNVSLAGESAAAEVRFRFFSAASTAAYFRLKEASNG